MNYTVVSAHAFYCCVCTMYISLCMNIVIGQVVVVKAKEFWLSEPETMTFTVSSPSSSWPAPPCSVALHLYSPPWEGRRGLSVWVSCVVPLPLSTALPLGASHSTVRSSSASADTLHTSVYSSPAVDWPSVEILTCSPGDKLMTKLTADPLTKAHCSQ